MVMMKLPAAAASWILGSLLLAASTNPAVADGRLLQGEQDDLGIFATETFPEEWDFCGLEYTETCPPTIPIELAACEAPLVLYGQVREAVNGETKLDAAVRIQVDYRSQFFSLEPATKTIQKWGAGLENTVEGSVFFNESGSFSTWVTGFNDTATDFETGGFASTPCGTRSPNSQEELYFFLEALPENEGKEITIAADGTLNVNFTLHTKILQSGVAPGTNDNFRLIDQGARIDDNRLQGECRAVYCCYNPSCDGCSEEIASVSDEFNCFNTFAPSGAAPSPFVSSAILAIAALVAGATGWF